MFLGIILIVIGLAYLAENLGFLPVGVWQIVWPLLIVVIGISLIGKKSGGTCWLCRGGKCSCKDGECTCGK
ncbi:MAG: DUF5668 domain-containing protein [Candidatus Parcubacteria bacterium]|nr:DUF5668 domain-containing protein [Candidatus Parcubacteria bacterium]